jgi:hypothetical protein
LLLQLEHVSVLGEHDKSWSLHKYSLMSCTVLNLNLYT